MRKEVRYILDGICNKIEKSFPGTIAAYEGFVVVRAKPEYSIPTIEIFNVAREQMKNLDEFFWEIKKTVLWPKEIYVDFIPISKRDTTTYYLKDVEVLLSKRYKALSKVEKRKRVLVGIAKERRRKYSLSQRSDRKNTSSK